MRSAFVVLLAVSAFAAASVIPGDTTDHRRVADKEFLVRQKDLLRLFVRPAQFNLYKDQAEIANTYKIEENLDKYTNVKAVKQFLNTYKHGVLSCKEIFSPYYPEYLEQAIELFNVFYFAKDFDTLYKTACWARDFMNDGQFNYALSIAVAQREDCKDFVLPPIYEIYPHLFFNNEVIQRAYEAKMQGENYRPIDNVYKIDKTWFIPSNFSGWEYTTTPEELVAYFTEDVGLNAFNTYWNYDYPFWTNSKLYNFKFDRRGELFYYVKHQLMARYHLERLSNGLAPNTPYSYLSKSPLDGFDPALRYQNGKEFPSRDDGHAVDPYKTEEVRTFESRIANAIDLGFGWTQEGKKISLKEEDGIAILGDMISGTGETFNKEFYGSLYGMFRTIYGHKTDPEYQFHVAPTALENLQTALRDPAYYTLYKRIDYLFKKYKARLPRYTYDELSYPGVKIETVEIDKLITYFDRFDITLDNAVDIGKIEEGASVDIRARQVRLNHKAFTYKVKVVSDKAATAMVRVFLGPRFDSLGNEYALGTMREYMVEMDRFTYNLAVGVNSIERNSRDSSVAVSDKPSYRQLFDQVNKAIDGGEPFYVDETERHCGWPQRLLLPKGKRAGLPVRFFVMVTPFDDKTVTDLKHLDFTSMPYCGVAKHGLYPDSKPMGYPFDRVIENYEYFYKAPNMHFEDVNIFHKKAEEVNAINP